VARALVRPGASLSRSVGHTLPVSAFETLAAVMRAQAPARHLARDPIDDGTVLSLLELAGQAGSYSRWRCEFVVVRDPDVRHELAVIHRQGWSIYRRVLRTPRGGDAELEARQWEADHFEDVPVLVVACIRGRRPLFPAAGAAAFYGTAFPAVQNLLLAAQALGLGAGVTALALWSGWQARRVLALPWNVTPVVVVPLGHRRGPGESVSAPPVENLVHLDRFGHQPFRVQALHQSATWHDGWVRERP
jgi:nitroreductase